MLSHLFPVPDYFRFLSPFFRPLDSPASVFNPAGSHGPWVKMEIDRFLHEVRFLHRESTYGPSWVGRKLIFLLPVRMVQVEYKYTHPPQTPVLIVYNYWALLRTFRPARQVPLVENVGSEWEE